MWKIIVWKRHASGIWVKSFEKDYQLKGWAERKWREVNWRRNKDVSAYYGRVA